MPFETPSLPTLISRTANDLASDALRSSDAQVLARVISGGFYGLYGYLDWISAQILPDTADAEVLERDAILRLEQARIPAAPARGQAGFTAAAGAVLDADMILQAQDGRQYRVTEPVTTAAGSNVCRLEAINAGALGNADGSMALTLVQPVVGVNDAFTVTGEGLTGGTDEESVEALRARVQRSYRVVPHGGDADDYVTWALECAGVTRAWTVRNYVGPGTVAVFIVRDGDEDPIPDPGEIAIVQSYIETRRPVTAELYVLAPSVKPVNYTIELRPDTSKVRAAVEAELRDLHDREASLGETLLLSHIREAISSAEGEIDHTLIGPVADIATEPNELLTFGGIEWVV